MAGIVANATCFNCGQWYDSHWTGEGRSTHCSNEFCSDKCMDADNTRLVEGNTIIAAAQAQTENTALSDLNKLRLDVSGPIGQTLGTMLHFSPAKPQPNRCPKCHEASNNGGLCSQCLIVMHQEDYHEPA